MAPKGDVKGKAKAKAKAKAKLKDNALVSSPKSSAAASSAKRGQTGKVKSINDLSDNAPWGSKAKPIAPGVEGSHDTPYNVQSSDSEAFNNSEFEDMIATKTLPPSPSQDLDQVLEKRRVGRHMPTVTVASSSKGPDNKPSQRSSEKHVQGQKALFFPQRLAASVSPDQQPALVTDKPTSEHVRRRESPSTPDNKRKNGEALSSAVSAPSLKKRRTPVMSAAQIKATRAQLSHDNHVVSQHDRRVSLALDGLLGSLGEVEPAYLEERGVYRDFCYRRVAGLVADLERYHRDRELDDVEEENALEAEGHE